VLRSNGRRLSQTSVLSVMANTRSIFATLQHKGIAYVRSVSRLGNRVAVSTVDGLPNLVIFNNWSAPFPCPKMRGVLRSPPPPDHPPSNVWIVFYYCYCSNSFLSSLCGIHVQSCLAHCGTLHACGIKRSFLCLLAAFKNMIQMNIDAQILFP
jgi:hypothetical protein